VNVNDLASLTRQRRRIQDFIDLRLNPIRVFGEDIENRLV